MLPYRSQFTLCLIGSAVALVAGRGVAADAANHAAVLAPFVNDDTLIVAHLDIASLPASDQPGELLKLLPFLSGDADAQSWLIGTTMIEGFVKRFQEAGGQGLYVVAGLGDVHIGGGPLIVATTRPGKPPQEIEQLFRDLGREIVADASQVEARPVVEQMDVERKGNIVLVGMKSTIERYVVFKATARPDLIDPLTKLSSEGAIGAAVFCPGPDYRRVSRELWPQLPGTLAPLSGELADRWLHFEAAVNPGPDYRPRIALQARDPEAAESFAKLWRGLPQAVTEFGGNEASRNMAKGFAQILVSVLPARVDGTRAEILIPTEAIEFAKLNSMLSQAADKSMESHRRNERLQKFKQIMLGMWNFESAKKHLPPAAICDKNGKPLLSWRVAILPYIDQNELYKQFHLDEPWDGPHNRPLVDQMPDIYADADAKLRKLRREGKTTFQVPVGPETIFYNNEGATIRDISDGTSQTIALVEVEPQRAVFWTQPEDWAVDLAHPKSGVERSDRGFFTAARCDGSVHIVPTKTDEKSLRALLTRKGREIIERQ